MSYPVGRHTKVKGQVGIYVYAGRGKHAGKQKLCFYFTYKKSGYQKVGWNHEGFSLADAIEKRAEYVRAMRYGEELPDARQNERTFSEGYEMYLRHAEEINKTSYYNDNSTYKNHLKPTFGKRPLAVIKKTEIERFLGKLDRGGFSANYRQRILTSLRQGFLYLKYEGICKHDPTAGLSVRGEGIVKERYLEFHEIQQLLDECDRLAQGSQSPLNWLETKAQILLGVEMGLRRSEMRTPEWSVTRFGVDYSLLWERIDWETGIVRIQGKGRKKRKLIMTPAVREALVALVPQKRGHVFFVQQYKRIVGLFNRLGFNDGLDPANPDDRVHRVTMHTLRHTFATYAVKRTKDLHLVARLLGHSDIQTTAVYAHLIKGREEEVMSDLGSWFEEQRSDDKVVPIRRVV